MQASQAWSNEKVGQKGTQIEVEEGQKPIHPITFYPQTLKGEPRHAMYSRWATQKKPSPEK